MPETDSPESVRAMAAHLGTRKGLSYQDQDAAAAMLDRYATLLTGRGHTEDATAPSDLGAGAPRSMARSMPESKEAGAATARLAPIPETETERREP